MLTCRFLSVYLFNRYSLITDYYCFAEVRWAYMIHDNAVRQVDNETVIVCPRTRTRVRRITNLFYLLLLFCSSEIGLHT